MPDLIPYHRYINEEMHRPRRPLNDSENIIMRCSRTCGLMTLDNALLWESLEKKSILRNSTSRDPFLNFFSLWFFSLFPFLTVEKFTRGLRTTSTGEVYFPIIAPPALTRPHLIYSRGVCMLKNSAKSDAVSDEHTREILERRLVFPFLVYFFIMVSWVSMSFVFSCVLWYFKFIPFSLGRHEGLFCAYRSDATGLFNPQEISLRDSIPFF
jgi:hypothetical protein